MPRHDLIIYGVTGYTGTKVLEVLLQSNETVDFAVAGRNENRIRKVLDETGKRTGRDLSGVHVIIADSENAESLASMAKQANVIVNTVGPFALYGEAVIKAAVENGANHVDVSGEPAFLESMQLKYSDAAKKSGVFIVGSCGWDSIPCDLGVNFLKEKFDGRLNHVESFIELNFGPAGFATNTGTYQSLILGMSNMRKGELGKMRRALMPEKVPGTGFSTPKRGMLWYNKDLQAYCLPFLGSDKSVVQRSQYFNRQLYSEHPVLLSPYITIKSWLWAVLLMAWLTVFMLLTQFKFTRRFLQSYPELCSFNMFKSSGPTEEQVKQASFVMWFYGSGWSQRFPEEELPAVPPNKQLVIRCDGPDPAYIATAGCLLASALVLLREKGKLPGSGGVFSPATAFKNTRIYEQLQKFGVTFKVAEGV